MREVALVFPYFRTRHADRDAVPAARAATLAAQLRGSGSRRGLRLHLRLLRAAARATCRLRPDIVGISSMVSLTRNTLRVAELVRAILPGQPARRRRPAADRLPRPLHAALRRRLPRRGRPELPALLPRLLRERALADDLGRLPLDTYDGLFVADHGLHGRQPDRAPQRERARRRSRCPTAATSTTPPIRRNGCAGAGTQVDLHHRHAGLPLRLRLLLEAGLRQRRAAPRPRRRLRRDRADPRARLRQPLDRRRHLHADLPYLEEFCRRMSRRGMSWSCLSRADGIDRPTVRADEGGRLPEGLPGPRVGQPGDARAS